MANFEAVDLRIQDGGGAVFEIATGNVDASFSYSLEGVGEVVLPSKGGVAIVRGLDVSDYDEAVRQSREGANRALDMSLSRGGVPLLLDHYKQPVIVWWKSGANVTLRIVSVSYMTMRFSATVTVRNAQGEIVPPTPLPDIPWDESLRFYRISEASSDLFDSFRNLYLAIEALLSSVSPPTIRSNGRAEPEGEWLERVLRLVSGAIDLEPFAPLSNRASHNAIFDELYGALRTAIFHAKRGHNVWLPQEWSDRERIAEARERYAKMYRALLHEYLGITFGGGGLSAAAFGNMTAAIFDNAGVYVSDDPTRHTDEPKGEYGIAPAGGRVCHLPTVPATEYEADYAAGVMGVESGDAIMASVQGIRRFGTIHNGQLAMVENLKAALDTSGIERVEVVLVAKNRNYGDPRRDFES